MILIDAGPLVALYSPTDSDHALCASSLSDIHKPLLTTVPVLTQAFHILGPATHASDGLREFVIKGGTDVWHFNTGALVRAFELMEVYTDHPMDLADASLVTAAESLGITTVFTLDRDFETYRFRRGHRYHAFEILPRRRR
jgi:predicted nucleic acid-binding protein